MAITVPDNQGIMSTQQMPAMGSTVQPGILAAQMNPNTTNTNGQTIDYTDQIKQLYKNNLGREGEQAGVDYWNKKLQGGETLAQVQNDFTNSNEYKALNSANKAPITTAASIPTPQQWNVSGNQTVAGNLASLIDPNNPYYQKWATAGAADAAARGFTGNGTLRDTSILNSVMNGALPVATSDASTYSKAAGYNVDQVNQVAAANAAAQNALNTANISANTQKYISDQSAETQKAVAAMSQQSQAQISSAHDANAVLLQNNSAAQAAYSAYVNAVANIDIQPSLDVNAKANAIATQTQIYNSAIEGIRAQTGSTPNTTSPLDVSKAVNQVGVDVSGYLHF